MRQPLLPFLLAGTELLASAATRIATIALGPQPAFGSALQMAVSAGFGANFDFTEFAHSVA